MEKIKQSMDNFKLKTMKNLILILFIATSFLNAQVLAFPEAVGHARFATGGRGGTTYIVTNLNDSGSGSLREAVEASGTRTVVFDISGTIDLQGGLTVSNPNITILGQTAPGDGICISNGSLTIATNEVIIRYIRARLGDGGYKDINGNVVGGNSGDLDTILINSGGNNISNIIIDHCSVSWGIDEGLSSYGGSGLINNVSITNNIISHGLNDSHHGDGSHSMGSLFNYNTTNISVIGNLYFGNGERHIRMAAGVTAEFHNNIVYGFKSAMVVGFGSQLDASGNEYYQGAYDLNSTQDDLFTLTSSGATVDGTTYTNTQSNIYLNDNWTNAVYPPNDLATSTGTEGYINSVSNSRLVSSSYVIVSRAIAKANILESAGATLPSRDSYDTSLIDDVTNNVLADYIDTQLEVGGFPTLTTGTPITDSNNDGIEDTWFATNVPNGSTAVTIAPNNYTYLENYVNQTEESESEPESAPVLDSAVLVGSDYILNFSQPANTKAPDGGYDLFINNVDQNDNGANVGLFTRTVSGLDTSIPYTFFLESRYTDTSNFPRSNAITVNPNLNVELSKKIKIILISN